MEELKVQELCFGDFFIAAKLIKKIDIKKNLKDLMELSEKKLTDEYTKEIKLKETKDMGLELFMQIIENIELAEKEVLQLIQNWTGKTPEEIKKFKFKELGEFYTQIITVNSWENIKAFFSQAAQ